MKQRRRLKREVKNWIVGIALSAALFGALGNNLANKYLVMPTNEEFAETATKVTVPVFDKGVLPTVKVSDGTFALGQEKEPKRYYVSITVGSEVITQEVSHDYYLRTDKFGTLDVDYSRKYNMYILDTELSK